MVQHPCQVSFKSMQGCRRSWEDKLKCVKILSVKDYNSAKISRTFIISPACTSRLVVQHLYHVSFKSMQGCRRSWEDKLWCDGMTEGRKDGMMDKANTKCPLAILWWGHKNCHVFPNSRKVKVRLFIFFQKRTYYLFSAFSRPKYLFPKSASPPPLRIKWLSP